MDGKTAQKKLKRFRLLAALTIFFFSASLLANVACTILTESTYRTLTGISTATDKAERISTYKQAIALDEKKPDAYRRLLSTYAEDGIFEKAESEEFLALYNSHHGKIRKRDSQYGPLLREIGFLYINGYPESTSIRIRMALPFLEQSLEYLDKDDPDIRTVNCYYQIGTYYHDYIWTASTVREVTDQVILDLITQIENTLPQFEEAESSIFDALGFYVAVCDLFYDQRDILADTVPWERVAAILDAIYDRLPEGQSLRKEQTRQLLTTLEGNRENYYTMIERAYARKGA